MSFTGKSIDQLVNFGWSDLIHPDDRQGFLDVYRHAFEKRESWVGEFRMLNKNNEYRWLHANGPVRYRPDGSFAGYISSSIDFTERKRAEQAAIENEKNLRNTILQAPVAMCLLKGPRFVVELANKPMFEVWGKTGEQVMHKPIFEGLPEAMGQGFDVLLEGVYTTGISFSAQEVPASLPRNGKIDIVYLNFVYEAYRESDGVVSGILAVVTDVSAQVIARQRIEEVIAERTHELEDANKDLQKSNAELAQFAYIASHDLQEPLRKIRTFSEMLGSRLGDKADEQIKSYLSKINNSSARMNALIRDVLNYSRLVKENEIYESVDLNTVIETIKADYDLRMEQSGATLYYTPLPTLEAIPMQMSQLFSNLVGNALKFIRSDVKPVINITTQRLTAAEVNNNPLLLPDLEYYKITFSDNGIGFKPEHADRIFNIFQRLHHRSAYEGTGIGLSMCKKITHNHHGDLNASGSSENGAVFNVILPLRQKGSG